MDFLFFLEFRAGGLPHNLQESDIQPRAAATCSYGSFRGEHQMVVCFRQCGLMTQN
jgi:hypothetical protein